MRGRYDLSNVICGVLAGFGIGYFVGNPAALPRLDVPQDSVVSVPPVVLAGAGTTSYQVGAGQERLIRRSRLGPLAELDDDLEPNAERLLEWAAEQGIEVHVCSVYRTYEQQADLWENRDQNPYPVASPGQSKHEIGRAFDLWTRPSSALQDLGMEWERLGGRWGGRFRDPIHFEG